jgi:hypothetical protein
MHKVGRKDREREERIAMKEERKEDRLQFL